MIKDKLLSQTKIPILSKGLDAYGLRHRALADNIANAETPGYVRRDVIFEEKLTMARSGGKVSVNNDKHIASGGVRMDNLNAELVTDTNKSENNDLNNVDIEREMVEMAENQMQYMFAARLIKMYFEGLQNSIRGM